MRSKRLAWACTWACGLLLTWAVAAQAQEPEVEPPDSGEEASPGIEPGIEPDIEPDIEVEADEVEPGESPAAEPAPDRGVEEIVITGTNIERSGFSSASPVEVINREELERSGHTEMKDVVKNLTSGSGNTSGNFFESQGVQLVNLRGLGGNATLVLLNGRRLVQTGAGIDTNFSDVSAVPLAMVERIEILRGGASAIYGSDAIAGVINIITKDDLSGLHFDVQGTTTDKFDHQQLQASVSGGVVGDSGALGLGVTYQRVNPLDAADRDFTDGNYRTLYGPRGLDIVIGRGDPDGMGPLEPRPTLDYLPAAGCPDPQGLISGDRSAEIQAARDRRDMLEMGTPEYEEALQELQILEAGASLAAQGLDVEMLYPSGDAGPHDTQVIRYDGLRGRGYSCEAETRRFEVLRPETDRINALLTSSYDLSVHTTVKLEGLYSHSNTVNQDVPSASTTSGVSITPGQAGNPYGSTALAFFTPLDFSQPPNKPEYTTDTVRVVASIGGDFGGLAPDSRVGEWYWEAAGSFGRQRYHATFRDLLIDNVAEAVNSCPAFVTGMGDSLMAATMMDAGARASTAEERAQLGCLPRWNLDQVSPEVRDSLTSMYDNVTHTSLYTGDAKLGGPIFELPGGDLNFVVGYQLRHERREADYDDNTNMGNFVLISQRADTKKTRNIHSTYAELALPVVRGIELQPAARFEHYGSEVGSSVSPRVGMVMSVGDFFDEPPPALEGLRLRGVYATAFRGPNLANTDREAIVQLASAVGGTGAGTPSTPNHGDPGLQAEEAIAYSAGIEWLWEGLLASLDFWTYDYTDRIVRQPAQSVFDEYACLVGEEPATDEMGNPILDAMGEQVTWGNPEPPEDVDCAARIDPARRDSLTRDEYQSMFRLDEQRPLIELNDAGEPEIIHTMYINAPSVFTQGIDFGLSYRFNAEDFGSDADFGTISFGGSGTYLLTFEWENVEGVEQEAAGKRNAEGGNFNDALPRLRFNAPVGWYYKQHGVTFITRYIGGFEDSEIALDPVPPPYPDVEPFVTFDLQYAFDFTELVGSSMQARIGIINLFDTAPPELRAWTNGGHDPSLHDNRGRLLYLRWTAQVL